MALRALYNRYGYTQYRMSKFEEYDLYARNKDFLISEGVITFTDTNGRLMALKPDVTLSIVKNTRDEAEGVQKLYYNENVYRVSGSTHSFREIVQLGLECIGDIDDYSIFEVLSLPANHVEIDGSGFVRSVDHGDRISGTGQVFSMNMSGDHMGGDYQTDNHVVAYDENKLVGWKTAPAGTQPPGWQWVSALLQNAPPVPCRRSFGQ